MSGRHFLADSYPVLKAISHYSHLIVSYKKVESEQILMAHFGPDPLIRQGNQLFPSPM
jgi:hypothetical protein